MSDIKVFINEKGLSEAEVEGLKFRGAKSPRMLVRCMNCELKNALERFGHSYQFICSKCMSDYSWGKAYVDKCIFKFSEGIIREKSAKNDVKKSEKHFLEFAVDSRGYFHYSFPGGSGIVNYMNPGEFMDEYFMMPKNRHLVFAGYQMKEKDTWQMFLIKPEIPAKIRFMVADNV